MFIEKIYAANDVNVEINTGVIDAILSAGLVVQLTLLILIVLSVVSWAIIFAKKKQLEDISLANQPFEKLFWKTDSLDDIFENSKDHPKSSMATVFKAGYLELKKIADSDLTSSNNDTPRLTGIDNLERSMRKAIDSEVSKLESQLSFLATTGSTSPFIGLFGTVWGIMGSFQKIGITKMATLAVVAPGISEALIATAIGLAAAIPATMAFNHYLTKIKRVEQDLDHFASDFLNIAKRNFFNK